MSKTPAQLPVGIRIADVIQSTLPVAADVHTTGVTADPKRVRPGDAFFVTAADPVQAASLASGAIERGARAIVSEEFLPVSGASQYIVADVRLAYAQLCHAIVGNPSEELPTVGVIASHGAPTVVRLVRSILQTAGFNPAAIDSLSLRGNAASQTARTSPATVARWMGNAVADHHSHAVTEIPLPASGDKRFAGVGFEALCITGLPESADKPLAARRKGVTKLLQQVGGQSVLIANVDDSECCRQLAEWSGPAITFGISKPADLTATVVEQHSGGQLLMLENGYDSVAIETSLLGQDHLTSCLAAAATALAMGIDMKHVAQGIQQVRTVPVRMQPVVCGQDFPVFLDASDSPKSVPNCIAAAGLATTGNVVTVIANETSEMKSLSAEQISVLAGVSDLVITTNRAASGPNIRVVEDRFGAIALAVALAEQGDALLITGCKPCDDQLESDEALVRQLIALRLDNTQDYAKAA